MRITIAARARADLESIHRYIAHDNPRAAAQMARRLNEAIGSLDHFPNRARPGPRPGTRELVTVRPYIIVYRVGPEVVEILRIWHGAQDRSSDNP